MTALGQPRTGRKRPREQPKGWWTGQKHPPQTAEGLPRTGQKQTGTPENGPTAHGSSRVNQAKTTAQPPKTPAQRP